MTTPLSSQFKRNVLPWVVCGLAATFYCYEYLLRIAPAEMLEQLKGAFVVNGKYLNATLVGELSYFYYYAYTPMQLGVGLFMDRYGPRWILTVAVLCCAAGTALFGISESYWGAAFGRFWIGFGSAFAFVGVLKLASTWLPADRFAMVSGLTTTLGMVGAIIGGVLIKDLIQQIGWRETIFYSSIIGFILVPVIWLVVRDAPSSQNKLVTSSPTYNLSYPQLWKEICISSKNPQIWINGMIGGLLMAPTMVFPELWGQIYLQTAHSFNELEASRVVKLIFLGWAVGGPIVGFFSDKLRNRRLPLMIGCLVTTLLLSLFFYYPGLTVIQIKILLFLIGVFSSAEVICFAIGRENCPSSLAGTVVAVTNFFVCCFSIFQVIVALILDWTWAGLLIDEKRVYSLENFQSAMLILPIATLLAFGITFFLKETHCKPYELGRGSA